MDDPTTLLLTYLFGQAAPLACQGSTRLASRVQVKDSGI
jgi:hypothetical protein